MPPPVTKAQNDIRRGTDNLDKQSHPNELPENAGKESARKMLGKAEMFR